MSKEDNLFQPEQIDEQITQLTSSQQQLPQAPDAHLISNLRQIYTEDDEIVERVWSRLKDQAAQRRQTHTSTMQGQTNTQIRGNHAQRPQFMKNISNEKRSQNSLTRLSGLVAALLVIGILVGGMVLLLNNNRQPLTSRGTATASITPSPGRTVTVGATPHSTPDQTPLACNASRSAIMTPPVGTDNSAVFYVTGGGGYQSMPSATSLIRYDLATGARAMIIPAANNSGIIDTTLSPDKQWLLLSIYTSKQNQVETEIKLIRTDGQLLQTVYKFCAPSFPVGIDALAWSPDEQYVAFSSDVAAISVLNLATGKLRTFQGNTTTTSYKPASWINNQQLLLTGSGNTSSGLYLLDINKDAHHPLEQLPLVASLQGFCHSVVLSSDGSQLFSSVCTPSASNCRGMQPSGPSIVSVMPSSGGSAHTIYSSQTNAVTNISTAGPSSLLIYIQNTAGDLKQDGLWRINTNGSGLIRLLTTNEHSCQYSPEPYPFTQIVNNGQVYTVLYLEGNQQKLVVGNLAGTSSKVIATNTIGSTNILVLVGVGAF